MKSTLQFTPLVNNQSSATAPFSKWRHFKEAFSPEIVYEAIRSCNITVHTCIDPFGGSGTTALTCQFAGVAPTTIEVNPYLADLIEAKLRLYDIDRLVRDLATLLHLADNVDPTVRRNRLPPTFVEPGIKDRWLFDRDVADRILSIALASEALKLKSHRRLFKVLLGGILIPLSNVVVNGKGRRYRSGWDKNRHNSGDVDLLFSECASAAIQEIRRHENRASSGYTVVRGDSREAIAGLGAFDLAVFSPPYPNSFDYTDVYNIELWMLGYLSRASQNRSLRQSTLSSHVQIYRDFAPPPVGSQQLDNTIASLQSQADRLWNQHIPAMIGGYFTEMNNIVSALQLALTPGGRIWIVVGDSSYAGVHIGVASILAELAPTNGLGVQRLDRLREMRKSAQQGGQKRLAESLLVLSKD